jgi:hypothetical protein
MVIARHLLGILGAEAPCIDLVIKPVTRIDLAEQIDLGCIDAAIGTFSVVPQRFKSDLLFGYDDVLFTHSGQKRGTITTETLTTLPTSWCSLAASSKAQSMDSRSAV